MHNNNNYNTIFICIIMPSFFLNNPHLFIYIGIYLALFFALNFYLSQLSVLFIHLSQN